MDKILKNSVFYFFILTKCAHQYKYFVYYSYKLCIVVD